MKNIVVVPVNKATFTHRELAIIAKQFQPNSGMRCKGALSSLLTPEYFDECWRIRELQIKRLDLRSFHHDTVRALDVYDRRGIKRKAWKSTLRWQGAFHLRHSYYEHLAKPIQRSWKYRSNVKYSVSLRHSQTGVKYESSRPACRYTVLHVTLTFDLLRHRWQWIGGMLTISAKTDAGKRAYPCWWFQQRKGGVGLEVKQGWMINRNYHVSAVDSEMEARAKRASIIRRAKEKAAAKQAEREQRIQQRIEQDELSRIINYKAPVGWVNRLTSLMAGNCESGTDNFIDSRIAPYFAAKGFIVGDLRGISIRARTLLEIEKSPQTRRVVKLSAYP